MITPYEYQQEVIDRYAHKDQAALLCDAGTGKTLIAIKFLLQKYENHAAVLPTIVFCPIIVLNNWKREILQCSNIPEESIGVCMGSKTARLKVINNPKHKIIIINYEATRSVEILDALVKFKARCVVCDESHKIKNPKVLTPKRKKTLTGAILEISKHSWYRVIMSGTPAPNPEDIWTQYYFLDRGATFGEKFYSFKKKFFVNKNAHWSSSNAYPDWQFIDSKKSEYQAGLARHATILKREDCVDLPDLVESRINVTPTPEMLKHYREVCKDLITWIDGQEDNPLAVQNALTKTLRLAEILSGYLRLEDDSIHKLKTNPTLDALMEIAESIGDNKMIVVCNFRQNYQDIAKALAAKKIGFVEIHGGVSTKDKLANVDIFNDMTRPERICILNPQSGGVGINLKAASYTTFYSMGYSLIDFEQVRARNYRSGSIDLHKKITHYFLSHQGLITEKIIQSVLNKKKQSANLNDIKELLRGH